MCEDVEARFDPAGDELSHQCLLVDDRAAGRVDEGGTVAEEPQPPGVQQAASLVGQRQMQRDGVGLPEQVVELAPTFFTLPAGVVEHAHVEGRGTRRNGSADPAQADDPKRRPRDVAAEEVRLGPTATPAALTDSTVGDDEPPPDREQQREREIGSRRRQHAGRIRERDSVRRARGRIDRVVADAVVRDDSEVREQVERLAVDPFADNGERQHVVAAPTRAVRKRRGQIFDVVELVPGRPGEAARGKRLQDAATLPLLRGGGSSVGRAPGCGPGGRGFESRPPPFVSATTVAGDVQFQSVARRGRWLQAVARFGRRPLGLVAFGIVALYGVVAALAGTLAPYQAGQIFLPLIQHPQPPLTAHHLLGTDILGKDFLTQILFAIHETMVSALVCAGVSAASGTVCGAIAGYYGG